MRRLIENYKEMFSNKTYIISLILALAALVLSFVANIHAVIYADAHVSSSVTDLILSNIRTYDVDGLFVNGAIGMIAFIILVCVAYPKRLPFVIKTIALFVIIRSIFVTLTHIGAFPTHIIIDPSTQAIGQDILGQSLYNAFFLGNDFFFSGHTGLPFLMAFLYYDNKYLRVIFILMSILFGVVVLLAHVHYTIDVLSAFFIAYGTYRMSRILFKKDLTLAKIETA